MRDKVESFKNFHCDLSRLKKTKFRYFSTYEIMLGILKLCYEKVNFLTHYAATIPLAFHLIMSYIYTFHRVSYFKD